MCNIWHTLLLAYVQLVTRLRALADKGHKTFLDSYGAKNEAGLFAVATEEFFDRPIALLEHAPDLYHVLSSYYRQEPAERMYISGLNEQSKGE